MTRILRRGGFLLAFWMVVVGIWAFVDSFNEPLPELQPVAGITLVVVGSGLALALWWSPSSERRGRAYGDDDD